ncbi:RNA methyltransferase, TrmH family, group 1 [Thermodesulfatator indicus DSM 15286]|uniref:tRNA (cytidine/uridine-2'-O-)-methyltransferase TrmJ n=2 Tax=Thermodesulfatator indicus TaxID=171695 RepID=F8ABI0_THEID|nr:RNA methyltransferase, TrmH family, group 1 [Thermodesulfatator indicus DSM 15286]
MENIAVVLVETLYPENIGSAARACANFGVKDLIVVKPKSLDREKMQAMATKSGLPVLENIKIFENLEEALAPFNYVVGTTARLGRQRKVFETIREAAPDLVTLSQNNKIAILFGNERWGLTNEDLYHCHRVVTIPTTEAASLNVAQAVVIILYELFNQEVEVPFKKPKLATSAELEPMYRLLKETLEAIDYVPHDNVTLWMTTIRRFLSRLELTSQEVRIIQGFCRNLLWHLREKDKKTS